MFEVYNFSETEILAFMLVMIRVSVFLMLWPVLSAVNVPGSVKLLFALAVTSVLFPLIGWRKLTVDLESQQFVWMVMREVFIGLTLGFMTKMMMFIVQVSGEIASVSLGLSNAQLFNPTFDSRASAVEVFEVMLASMLFLAINGHHYFITGLMKSFEIVPISTGLLNLSQFAHAGEIVQKVVESGLMLAAPAFASIFILNLAMGVVGKAVPQVNVFVVSLPVNIIMGLIILFMSMPMFLGGFTTNINRTIEMMFRMMRSL